MKTSFPEVARVIPGLDGLRAIAILLVFATHVGILEIGWVGVQLFFVLSGFLITGILLDMKESLPVREYFRKFYGRRFLRIFPLYYFYLLAMVVVAYFLIARDIRPNYMQIYLRQVWYAILYVYDFFYRAPWFEPSRFLDHFWSLSVEEQFYIVWPLLLLVVLPKDLKKLFLSFVGLGLLFRLILYVLYLERSELWFFREPFALVIYTLPFSHVDAFAMGAYISRFSIPHARIQLLLVALITPILGYGSTYLDTGGFGDLSGLGYNLNIGAGYQFIWSYTLLNYLFTLLIYCVVRERLFVRFLELPWMRFLGRISYGMYVYHLAVIWFVERFFEERMPDSPWGWPAIVIALSITTLISTLSYYFLERPILNLKDRFFQWSPPRPQAQNEPG